MPMLNNDFRKIKIDNLTLRCFEEKDAILLKNGIDKSLKHLIKYMDWAKYEPKPLQHKIEKIRKWRKEFNENKNFTYGIFENGLFLGNCGLYKRTKGNILEIGYWTTKDNTNKGIATKASLALTILAFEKIKVDRIEIHLYKNNKASARIPEKLKYKKLPDYTFEKENDSSWYILDKKLYLENKKYYSTMYKKINFEKWH